MTIQHTSGRHLALAGQPSGRGRWRALGGGAVLALATALSAFAPAAQAQTRTVGDSYWGLSLGQGRAHAPQGSLFNGDRNDTSYKLSYGRHLSPHFGAEAAVYRLGKFARGGGDTTVDGASLSAVGRIPVDRFTLFGKVGANYGRTHTSTAALSDVAAGKATGWNPSVGVGVAYDLSPNTAVVAEWERHRLDFAGSGRSDVDNTSIGLRWKF